MSERAAPYPVFILGYSGLPLGLKWGRVGWRPGHHSRPDPLQTLTAPVSFWDLGAREHPKPQEEQRSLGQKLVEVYPTAD